MSSKTERAAQALHRKFKRLSAALEPLMAAYLAEVDGIAKDLQGDVESEHITTGEQLVQTSEERCKDHFWVTNEERAAVVLLASDNSGYALSEGLVRRVDPNRPTLPWASLAGYAMERDVKDALFKLGLDLNADSFEREEKS